VTWAILLAGLLLAIVTALAEDDPGTLARVEDLYRAGDPLAFESSPAWRTEFVGLGPYRVTEWEAGSYLKAEAFGQYFLGRPKIDRLELRWVPDPTIVVAQLLAGAVDMVTPSADIKPVQLAEIQRLWGPEGGRTYTAPTDIRILWTNQRIEGQSWDAQAAGCPGAVTPFNGDHNAGSQVLSTKQFDNDKGPLRQLTP
jgi:ABC-type transport system substrate-binding protein